MAKKRRPPRKASRGAARPSRLSKADFTAQYHAYMASPEWAARKARFFRLHERRCQACGDINDVHLHHRSYERFTHEHDADLRALCQQCHTWVHNVERNTSLSLAEATDTVIERQQEASKPRTVPPPVGRGRSAMEVAFDRVREMQRAAAKRDV